MERDNDAWLRDLRSAGAPQQAALADLRATLVARLQRGLPGPLGRDDALVEDAAQDALLRIIDRLGDFAGRSMFLTWATSVAIRVALTHARRRRWGGVGLFALGEAAAPPGPDQSEADARRELLELVRSHIATGLTERQRTALEAELKGMPQVEIARQLGITTNALYKLTHDARKALKRSLEAAGYGTAEVHDVLA